MHTHMYMHVCTYTHAHTYTHTHAQMGLGKTVQATALLAALHEEEACPRPHLIVVPLSTLRNWERELAAWAPALNVVTLSGSADARKVGAHVRKHAGCSMHTANTCARARRRGARIAKQYTQTACALSHAESMGKHAQACSVCETHAHMHPPRMFWLGIRSICMDA